MKVMIQIAMVVSLDKCIGCYTRSATYKQAWTNRKSTEYMWSNNVETRPGIGYPRGQSDQDKQRGGWHRTRAGKSVLEQGGRLTTLAKIFHSPTTSIQGDYYKPWIYRYGRLLRTPVDQKSMPSVPPVSRIIGEGTGTVTWDPDWDDNLDGPMETLNSDPVLKQMNLQASKIIEGAYMSYLPRICEYYLNPACASVYPSGTVYKRTENSTVLIGQDEY